MMTIELSELFSGRHLAVRDEAHRLSEPLQELDSHELILDFSGIRGVSPSFLDEMMSEITSLPQTDEWLIVVFKSPPMERTGTIERIIDGRGGSLDSAESQEWRITFGRPPSRLGFWESLRERLFQ